VTGSAPAPRPAFYALSAGGWRDYVTLLHLPYTAWHLAYVVVGACLAVSVHWWTLALTLLAFALAMGVGAHALDELGPAVQPVVGAREHLGALVEPGDREATGEQALRDEPRAGRHVEHPPAAVREARDEEATPARVLAEGEDRADPVVRRPERCEEGTCVAGPGRHPAPILARWPSPTISSASRRPPGVRTTG
jgi:hypothetical protein